MKIFFVLIVILLCACQSEIKHEDSVVIAVDTVKSIKQYSQLMVPKEHNFGSIYKNKIPHKKILIEVFNAGEKPLVLAKIDVVCSCMKVDFTRVPIQSKQKGCINIVIDTKNQEGIFDKPIFIRSNAVNDLEIVRIKGEIK